MIFALGFLVAGMLTLLFLPMFWRRAMRLSARRLEMQMPLSMTEIVAERDQLRAEFAAERRKLEQKSEKLVAGLANSRVELGERAVRISGLEGRLEVLEHDEAEARDLIERLERQMSEMELERVVYDKAHYDAAGLLDRRSNELRQLQRDHEALNQLSDERRMAIAGLETQLAGVEMEFDVSQQNLARTQKDLAEKSSQVQFLERERDQFRADAVAARERREALLENIAAQQKLVEKLDAELRTGRRERARLAEEASHLNTQIREAGADSERLKRELRTQAQALASGKQAIAERTEAQKSAQAVLQGALDAARRDNQALRAEISELRRTMSKAVSAKTIMPESGEAAAAMQKVASAAATVAANDSGGAGRPEISRDEQDLAELRQAIAAFGNDIIGAAEAARKPRHLNGGKEQAALAAPVDDLQDLPVRIRELQDRILPAAGSN